MGAELLSDEALRRKKDAKEAVAELQRRKAQLRQMDRFETRLEWRSQMDYSVRRLLVDLDLARDVRVQKDAANQIRCDHLDKVHEWYLKHGKKEARKEKTAEPYIFFEPDAHVQPGSTRPTPFKLRNMATRGSALRVPPLRHSSSTPSLSATAATDIEAGVQT